MDLSKVVAELRRELERLDAAILSLERLKEEDQRRGRPPKEPAGMKRASGGGRPNRKRAEDGGAESA